MESITTYYLSTQYGLGLAESITYEVHGSLNHTLTHKTWRKPATNHEQQEYMKFHGQRMLLLLQVLQNLSHYGTHTNHIMHIPMLI